jgi:5'-nucleotidase
MRVLITNDDGVMSPGIHELARHIEDAGYEVIVVAPDHDASGTGASLGRISPDAPVKITQTEIEGLKAEAFGISGPPAMCVVAAVNEAFGPAPDIVVSGINAGLNTGRSTLHSGTVGAALAGQNFGLRGLAVSLDPSDVWQWATAAALAVNVLPEVMAAPARVALNLNVPGVFLADVKGVRWAGLAAMGSVRSSVSRVEDGHIHFEMVRSGHEPEEHTDLATVRSGYAALTALHGTSEVWGPAGRAGEIYHPSHGIHGASAGHELRPASSVLRSNKD